MEPSEDEAGGDNPVPWDLVTLGETMVAFVPEAERPEHFRATCIGAESNVAGGFARFGGRALWVSRLGRDMLGRLVRDTVTTLGVAVAAEQDPDRPTGAAIKEVGAAGTTVRYYRTGSAASGLAPSDLPPLPKAGWLHLTGITPALSASADQTVEVACARARRDGVRISFDVNLRPVLWPDLEVARRRLLELCRAADLVFVGSDEAEALVGSADPPTFASRAGITDEQELVVKDGARGATVLVDGSTEYAQAHQVPVVDVTGAGDAFAAAYLAAFREGNPPAIRLRWGHWNAARAVQGVEDVPPAPTPQELEQVRSREFHPPLLAGTST